MAKVRPDEGGEFPAVAARHGPEAQIDVDADCGARSCPVTGLTAGGRSLDHGGRHGELAHARPEGRAGIPNRGRSERQHSPCADGSLYLFVESVIAASLAPVTETFQNFLSDGARPTPGSTNEPLR